MTTTSGRVDYEKGERRVKGYEQSSDLLAVPHPSATIAQGKRTATACANCFTNSPKPVPRRNDIDPRVGRDCSENDRRDVGFPQLLLKRRSSKPPQ